jgi:tetratricopeptide (TPR) repeat protein
VLSECPPEDQLAAFVAGDRSPDADLVRSHLDTCTTCRRAVSALAAAQSHAALAATQPHAAALAATQPHPAFGPDTQLGPGTRLGRFTMKRLLGEGAMGEVWAAHDPELDREVAIKLLRVTSARLRREAQAMARVRHPNVVAIYELGWTDDHGFCAMELVDGATLRAHLETKRPWREVLDLAVAVGRGLSAAHGTGVIHRDIKPENILIARDGRTLVSDFGLAKLAGPDDPAAEDSLPAVPIDPNGPSGTHLTTKGVLIGTPAYMAPEQLVGDPASMLSDQFSFCVVVYEALFGARPFQAATVGALRESIRKGLVKGLKLRAVPTRVLEVLERGLAADPARRWPSMDALLSALERAMRRRRWWLAAAVPALAAVAATVYIAVRNDGPTEAEARAAAEHRIEAAWNPSIAHKLADAFVAVDATNGPARAAALTAAFDRYRDDWLAHRLDAWRATHVRGEQTLGLLERRLACFDHLADAMGQMATLLLAPAAKEVQRAPDFVTKLEPIANCDNAQRFAAQSIAPTSPKGRAADAELNQIKALQLLGRNDEALRRAQAALADPQTMADPMLHARARYNVGDALNNAGHYGEAESVLRLAVQEAAAAHDHYLVATVWIKLVEVVSFERPKDAIALEPVAQAAVALAGNDPLQLAELALALGLAEVDPKAAHDHLVEARDRWISIYGPDHQNVAETEATLGVVLDQMGEYDEALKYLDHARQIVLSKLGDKDPMLASIELNRAGVATERNDLPAAEASLRAALAIDLAVRAQGNPETLAIRTRLSRLFRRQQRYAEAHESLALARKSIMADNAASPDAIDIDEEDAELALAEHDWTRAETVARTAVAGYKQSGNDDSLVVAMDDLAKAVVHRSPQAALEIEKQACELYLKTPHSVSDITDALDSLATIAVAARRPEVALAWFDKYPDAAAPLTDDRAQLERLRHK